ncbi:MAG: hypothetical protein US49_C0001G0243 [candidate division TM6 bacterium GW2011_GWF2_37_49]|nr:MAG: hypothetical protein US49_C0001G0243 [candidate division TM6 bacterium GW2011_GWF2_37_49]
MLVYLNKNLSSRFLFFLLCFNVSISCVTQPGALEPKPASEVTEDAKSLANKQKSKSILIKKLAYCGGAAAAAALLGGSIVVLACSGQGSGNALLSQQVINFNNSPDAIVGKFVTLKKINEEHSQGYIQAFSESVAKEYESKAENSLLNSLVESKNGNRLSYCIFENTTNTLIGEINIRKSGWCGNLGNWVNERYQGNGYYQEALGLVVHELFTTYKNVKNFTAHVRRDNHRSYYALKKFGFKEFNDLPKHIYNEADHTLIFTRASFEEKRWNFVQADILDPNAIGGHKLRWIWQ